MSIAWGGPVTLRFTTVSTFKAATSAWVVLSVMIVAGTAVTNSCGFTLFNNCPTVPLGAGTNVAAVEVVDLVVDFLVVDLLVEDLLVVDLLAVDLLVVVDLPLLDEPLLVGTVVTLRRGQQARAPLGKVFPFQEFNGW
jgi:hypothetical protein